MPNDEQLRQFFITIKTIAVVGLSANPDRPSYRVASYLKKQGYQIIPISSRCVAILGERCFSDLTSAQKELLPTHIEVVDIFRRSEDVSPHVDEAIAIGARTIWMQEGIEHLDAAAKAESAGLTVVMNRCLMKEHQRLMSNSGLRTGFN